MVSNWCVEMQKNVFSWHYVCIHKGRSRNFEKVGGRQCITNAHNKPYTFHTGKKGDLLKTNLRPIGGGCPHCPSPFESATVSL